MLTQMLKTQWLRVRVIAVLTTLILFTLPLLIVRVGPSTELHQVGAWLQNSELIGRLIPIFALAYGMYLGLSAWADDLKGGHVYALSLPVSRQRYVLMRYLAQAVGLVPPALGILASGLLATAIVDLPSGVHAYPVALAGRTFLALLVCYTIFFTIAVSLKRAVVVVLGAVLLVAVSDLLLSLLFENVSVSNVVFSALVKWPGPLAILVGRWALFDV